MDILRWFSRKPTPAKEFESCVFSFVAKRVADQKAVATEIHAAQNLATVAVSEEERQKLAARWYSALENHIAREQQKNRIPPEILRERILNKCRPERAAGNFALIFLPGTERQIRLFEGFTERVLEKALGIVENEDYKELLKSLESDGRIQGLVKDGKFFWEAFRRTTRALPLAEKLVFTRDLCKRALAIIAQKVSAAAGELRAELMFKNAYREFRDNLSFIEDVPKVLLLVPEQFLADERVGLMEKSELEEELRRQRQTLESTVAELQGEKLKLSSLTREELEKKVEERTAELVNALEDVKAGRGKLAEAKAKDEAFLENIGDGLAAIDLKWNILLWNKAASGISGWPKEEVLGKPLRSFIKLVHERDGSSNMAFIDEAMMAGEKKVVRDDTVLVTKGKKRIAVSASASPVLDEKGKVTSAIIIFRDTTNEHALQKAREEFASLATHELRTPVAAIRGYVSLLLDGSSGPLHEKQKKYLEEVRHSNERLLALVNAMLNVSRIELGTLAVEPKPTYLPDVADSVLAELDPKISEKKLEIKKNYDSYHLPIIDVDPSLMRAVFQNLLSNAVKYTPEGGKVSVAIKRQDEDVLIEVADTGYGIPKNQQSKVFDKLFRADNVKTKGTEGTGLGLYMVKSVLDQCGGKIWFESEENKGTTFCVTVPVEGMQKKEGIRGLS